LSSKKVRFSASQPPLQGKSSTPRKSIDQNADENEFLIFLYIEIHIDDLLGRSLVVFCTFITLFGFREFRRVLGEEKFHAMLLGSGEAGKSDLPDPALNR